MELFEDMYKRQLGKEIEFFLLNKTESFQEIIRELGSVDIPVAREIYNYLIENLTNENPNALESFRIKFKRKYEQARSKTAQFIYELPAPNSIESQWWFSLDSIDKIAMRMRRSVGKGPIAFFGAPTVAYFYNCCFDEHVTLLDNDQDILRHAKKEGIDTHAINLLTDSMPTELSHKFLAVFMDPPWYENHLKYFINHSALLLMEYGYVFASIPSQLTRPSAKLTRKDCLDYLNNANMQIVSMDSDYFNYVIPAFENIVLNNIKSAMNRPWRKSDLIIAQSEGNANAIDLDAQIDNTILSFYREGQANQFRIFLKEKACNPSQIPLFERVLDFSQDVSTRRNSHERVHLWTSNQIGYSIGSYDLVLEILNAWKLGQTLKDILESLSAESTSRYCNIENELLALNSEAFLWKNDSMGARKTPMQICDLIHYSPIAIQNSVRRREQANDGFRMEFQRDRDRIIWAQNFRKLANKSQVFSFEYDEMNATRTRLTHSIEVMQLASTIGSSFALNKDLIEAGALCHDIGHTPFGHGGEYALNQILNEIKPSFGGFNHYEHGLDVVEYLENPYIAASNGGFHGLNLMTDTLECIFKHTFSKSYDNLSQDILLQKSKHKRLINNLYGVLESQTVRIADKISYMISDIEDGIKLGAIHYDDLISCRLFNKAPIDLNPTMIDNSANSLYNLFISQRRSLLKIIMEDVLTTSEKLLSLVKSHEDIRNADDYHITFSHDIQDCMAEVWEKLQSGILHNDSRVKAANLRAAQIVNALFYLYAFWPELIDTEFRINHSSLKESTYLSFYCRNSNDKIGISKQKVAQYNLKLLIGQQIESEGDNHMIPIYNVVLSKDYVASFTDQRAIKEYHAHFGFIE